MSPSPELAHDRFGTHLVFRIMAVENKGLFCIIFYHFHNKVWR